MKAKTVYRQSKVVNQIKETIEKELPRIQKKADAFSFTKATDPLSEELGQTSYQTNMRFEWLKKEYGGKLHPLEVQRYYSDLKLCIDIRRGSTEIPYTDEKEVLCKQNGYRYFYLTNQDDIKSMLTIMGAN